MSKKRTQKFFKQLWNLKYLLIFIFIVVVFFRLIIFLNPPPLTGYWVKVGNTYNCSNCSDCNDAIANASSGDIIHLTADINDQIGTCIDFNGKDNITFDCQGHYINGDGSTGYGIYLNDSSNNNTIQNCNITGFYDGLYLYSSSNNTLTNITANSNIFAGFYLYSSSNNTLTDITANSNNRGLYIYSTSNNNTFTDIISNNNSLEGIKLEESSNNIFLNAISQENSYWDIHIYISTDSQCNNNFTNITGSGNRPIEFYNSNVTIENKVLSELILCNADNSIFDNITIHGSDTKKNNWLLLSRTSNTSLFNINSSGNEYGIYIEKGLNITLINITSNNNSNRNIYLTETNYSSLINVIAEYANGGGGIELGKNSFYNILTNITSNNNVFGVTISSGGTAYENGYNTLKNIVVKFNSQDGVLISGSSNNNLTNITASSNSKRGIRIYTDSEYNIINDSKIENNTQLGIKFEHASSYLPQYNLLYNNFFNNTANYYNSTNFTNYFNTTNTSGTNIMGGPYIGGNYWAYPNGTGFSETCTDSDNDGFGDSSYNIEDSGNYDYLPLICYESWSCTEWSTCVGGTQTRTCTDANNCGTTANKPAESQSCTVGGGGGNVTPQLPEEIHSWTKITLGTVAIMKDFDEEFGIKQIEIQVRDEAQDVKVTVTKHPGKPAEVTKTKSGKVYKYLQIETENLEDKLDKGIITIQVNKSWVFNNNLNKDKIDMFKFVNDEWVNLTTAYKEQDNNYYYYDIELTSFSYFAISGEVVEEPTDEEEVEVSEGIKSKFIEIIKNYIWWILLFVLIIAITIDLIILISHLKKRKENKRLEQIMEYEGLEK